MLARFPADTPRRGVADPSCITRVVTDISKEMT